MLLVLETFLRALSDSFGAVLRSANSLIKRQSMKLSPPRGFHLIDATWSVADGVWCGYTYLVRCFIGPIGGPGIPRLGHHVLLRFGDHQGCSAAQVLVSTNGNVVARGVEIAFPRLCAARLMPSNWAMQRDRLL